ncbi:MetQ/NlpA family ABC transporter substrate-binding protein [Paenibacillus filicis]|uniref:MetQ/NlpA family ABC transporter substrate-binding protein n=1 Tax=Paenibacillus filicis TaxID=669464 RepID=A0ABU9DF27_9BACL
MIRKSFLLLMLAVIAIISACGSKSEALKEKTSPASSTNGGAGVAAPAENKTIKLLVSAVNRNDELAPILKKELEKQGYELKYEIPTDGIIANKEVLEGTYDVNIGMHTAFLKSYNEANKTNLVEAFKTTFSPNGVYSKKYKSLEQLPEGATISIPNDGTNGGRALVILQNAGLVKLKEGIQSTKLKPSDIIENPRKFKIKEVDNSVLVRALDDVDAGFLYQSLRIQAGFKFSDALAVESSEAKDFYIIAATRPELAGSPKLKALQEAYYSQAVKDFYLSKFDKGSIYFAW